MSASDLADKYRVSSVTIYKILKANNIPRTGLGFGGMLHAQRLAAQIAAASAANAVHGKPVGYEAAPEEIKGESLPRRRTLMQRIKDFFRD